MWGFESSLVSSNSHHSSHGSKAITSSPCNMKFNASLHQSDMKQVKACETSEKQQSGIHQGDFEGFY